MKMILYDPEKHPISLLWPGKGDNFRNKENTKCVSYMFYHFDKAEPTERHVVTGVDHHHSPTQLKKQIEAKSG